MRHLPPLTSMRTFEAAGRHGSFTKAASELCVTQAAISHQVKELEDWLGIDLFERRGHEISLTRHGKAYLPEITAALDRLTMATERLGSHTLAGPLRITVLPSFATKWLTPRIGSFSAVYPSIDLHIVSTAETEDFSQSTCDLGIRLGLGCWPGLKVDLIANEVQSPVCGATLANGPNPLVTPLDLRSHTLLHDRPRDRWQQWLEMADAADVDATSGVSFSDSSMVLQAAIDGHGYALGIKIQYGPG